MLLTCTHCRYCPGVCTSVTVDEVVLHNIGILLLYELLSIRIHIFTYTYKFTDNPVFINLLFIRKMYYVENFALKFFFVVALGVSFSLKCLFQGRCG
jgi:hypothetical protein